MWEALTTPAGTDDVLSPPALAFLALFGVGFVASVLLANGGARRLAVHPIVRRAVRRYASWGIGVFGAGLFFFGVRALQINPFGFGMPIWLWLCLAAALALGVSFAYALRTTIPARIAAYDQQRLKEQYLKPAPKPARAKTAGAKASSSGRFGGR